MLRYVRIENGERRMFLGAELGLKTDEAAKNEEANTEIDENLNRYFEKDVDTWSLSYMWNNLRGFALFTAGVHGFLFILVAIAIIVDEANKVDHLKSMTTKTTTAWVGINAPRDRPIVNFGPNPKELETNITVSGSCTLAGDYASRSSKFNKRQVIVEVTELDSRIMILAFFLLSALFQLSSAWDATTYYAPLKQGNARRSHLVEYSATASLMMVIICLQVEVVDSHTLANVFTNTWACMFFGLLSDVLSETVDDTRLKCVVLGRELFSISYAWLAHLCGWFTLFIAAAVSLSSVVTFNACLSGIHIPGEALAAMSSEAVLFFCFGSVQIYTLLYKQRPIARPRTLNGMQYFLNLKIAWAQTYAGTTLTSRFITADSSTLAPTASTDNALDKLNVFNGEVTTLTTSWLKSFSDSAEKYSERQKERILVAYRAEYTYLILSLVAKTVLGGIVYISAIMKT